MVAPLVMLISVRAVLERAPTSAEARTILRRRSIAFLVSGAPPRREGAARRRRAGHRSSSPGPRSRACSRWSTRRSGRAATHLRWRSCDRAAGTGSVLVARPAGPSRRPARRRLDLAWELRGNRICIAAEGEATAAEVGASSTITVFVDDDGAVVPKGGYFNRAAGAQGDCPLIPDAARADPSAGG